MKGKGRCGRLGDVAATVSPPGALAKDKKRAILQATLAVLRERGLSGLKMEEVARRAEVGKGTIYLYFRDKRDLLKALVEERTRDFYQEVEEVVRLRAPFFVRLEALLQKRLAWVEEWRGLWAAVAREAVEDPTPWLKGLHQRYLDLLEELVQSGQKEGAVRPELSPKATAAVIAALGCSPLLEVEAYVEHLLLVLRKGVSP
ncbi:Transcriptional regulator (TetR/AcrR family) [Thermus sp. CCB_US3_UF1]|uniref:TetR/AcrR family transcriptional regulator n=1 Tax=unclassified Thermus TaxID=2619321 RepID=UPI00023891AA|nr:MULTISPECIES: TetR/AcrR family transcriptional regulator [unclassified Thermus]AEV17017.1 Transcriptional regulator (TetR/AcrR family) [Thermus sp. CCB_US3_UF1]MDW8017880.1 TetR/AcrR family transcriptional regulator [Thermus sp.]MDW8356564.1 TetR/AcrR family transcriptional regulator [Thermus sp.]